MVGSLLLLYHGNIGVSAGVRVHFTTRSFLLARQFSPQKLLFLRKPIYLILTYTRERA